MHIHVMHIGEEIAYFVANGDQPVLTQDDCIIIFDDKRDADVWLADGMPKTLMLRFACAYKMSQQNVRKEAGIGTIVAIYANKGENTIQEQES